MLIGEGAFPGFRQSLLLRTSFEDSGSTELAEVLPRHRLGEGASTKMPNAKREAPGEIQGGDPGST
jgi:hypothetical protein